MNTFFNKANSCYLPSDNIAQDYGHIHSSHFLQLSGHGTASHSPEIKNTSTETVLKW